MAHETTTQTNNAQAPTGTASITVTDNRTGKSADLAIENGAIQAKDLLQFQAEGEGLCTYDPGFLNTAACKSAITFIDGDKGILEYRGYPIEQLAEKKTFLEVAWLLLEGELPTPAQAEAFAEEISVHTLVPEGIRNILAPFHHNAHPMSMLMCGVAALGTFYDEAKSITDAAVRRRQIIRLIAKMPTLAAMIYRHGRDLHPVLPSNELGYAENFLSMMFRMTDAPHTPDPVLVHAMDVLFTLHADHEQNCSTNAVRGVGSSGVDPFTATAAGIGALFGPLHGGANEAVLRMLAKIGSLDKVPAFIESVKAGEGRLMGFGHRVYKNYDPRARIIKNLADQVFDVTKPHPLLPIAKELEKIALEDEYFIKRKLYPNVDFYSGLIYQAMNFPVDFFTVLFAVGRTPGWVAQWDESNRDKEQKIARPKQIFLGPARRDVP
ncbi:MAG: citrate synthase [bacterium]